MASCFTQRRGEEWASPAEGKAVRIAVDARYLSEPFRSMTVYCSHLLRALVSLDLERPPIALLPRELDASAHSLRDELGDSVVWLIAERDRYRSGRLIGELFWVHREIPALLSESADDVTTLITVYHQPPAKLPGVKRLAVVHDLCGIGEAYPKHRRKYWQQYIRLWAAAHYADTIWPISQATSHAMAERFPRARARIGPVLYNGVDRQPLPQAAITAALQRHGLHGKDYVVAFATRDTRKNFALTIATVRELLARGEVLRLAAIASENDRADIEQWCASEGIQQPFVLTGLSNDELDAIYAGAVALLWPSTCEGFGYPVVESMAQGCPPLVWSVGPAPELIGRTIDPISTLEPTAWADRVCELRNLTAAEGERLRQELGQRAGEFSFESYRSNLRSALELT